MTDPKKPVNVWASPEGGLVLLAAIVTAVVASMPVVLLPGALAYAILVYLRYTKQQAEAAERTVEADVSKLAQPYASRALRAEALGREVLAEIAGAEKEHQMLLAGMSDRVRHLVAAAARLAERLQELDRHLAATPRAGVEQERRALERKIEVTRDARAREGYARALDQQRQKEQVFEELSARRERIDAQLEGLEKTLETASAQVVRIKSAEGAEAGAEGVRIAESLDALALEVDAAAETVDEAAANDEPVRRGRA